MPPRSLSLALVLSLSGAALAPIGVAAAGPSSASTTLRGTVTAATARWAGGGTRIVTDVVVRTDDGRDVTVSQFGGTVDGIGMIEIPGPALLVPGQRATITARASTTARARDVLVVEQVALESNASLTAGRTADFVRTGPTKAGAPVHWASGCVQMTYAAEGTGAIAGISEFDVIDRTLAAWNDVDCSFMSLVAVGRAEDAEVGNDRINLIKFRDQRWCRPSADDDGERCHKRNAAGITTLVFVDDADSDRDGEILDADVELNGVDFAIAVDRVSFSSQPCQAELANTLTHELGHVLGFSHTCITELEEGQAHPFDHHGELVPYCDEVDQAAPNGLSEATMYPAQSCGETKKSSLADNDIEAICAVYPTADDPEVCEPPAPLEAGCCSTGGGAGGSLLLGAATALLLAPRRRA